MMHQMIRPAVALLLGMVCVVASAFATGRNDQPQPTDKPEAETKTQPASETEQPEPTESTGDESPAENGKQDDATVHTPPNVSADDVLKAFQKERPTRVPIAPSGASDRIAADGDSSASGTNRRLPDGFFLVDRVGRVAKDGDWYVFAFEGYNESRPDPPMKMLPNQLLERMVLESKGSAGDTVFIVSGEVTEFMGENYLLLRKLLRRRSLGNLEK